MRALRLTGLAVFLLAACTPDVRAQASCSGEDVTSSPATETLRHYSLLYEADKADELDIAAEQADCLRELAPWAASPSASPFDKPAGVERFLEMAVRAYEGTGREEAAVDVITEVLSYVGDASRARWEGWLEERQ